jgi:hypothetical protein
MLSVGFICLALHGCGESPPPRPDETKKLLDEETELMKDPGPAGRELERRLLNSVSVQDGLVVIRDPLTAGLFTYVLPTTSPWVISCGIGLSVAFGTAVSGDGSSVGNEVQIHLVQTFVNQEACSILAPQLGRRLKALLQEHVDAQ